MPHWKKGKPHQKPYTDEERIADGQQRYEYRDREGNCLYYCYRKTRWEANRAFRYHMRTEQARQKKLQEQQTHMAQVLARYDMERKKKMMKDRTLDIDHLSFFDLQKIIEA